MRVASLKTRQGTAASALIYCLAEDVEDGGRVARGSRETSKRAIWKGRREGIKMKSKSRIEKRKCTVERCPTEQHERLLLI